MSKIIAICKSEKKGTANIFPKTQTEKMKEKTVIFFKILFIIIQLQKKSVFLSYYRRIMQKSLEKS